ncbi:uncharacterized protein KY384_004081 [Bacidia gigantensis]|uniref:uncharacterized protein n=1 Tax=Bacidia gigantensis TaxID=2732470 RepID=UPI001D05310C|nr:uncharacterized protein KY384_004081 [Bacidia gigantensis]KAG8530724.1 hypothetical protein KY384_004081 [Bacidia gigantensis]
MSNPSPNYAQLPPLRPSSLSSQPFPPLPPAPPYSPVTPQMSTANLAAATSSLTNVDPRSVPHHPSALKSPLSNAPPLPERHEPQNRSQPSLQSLSQHAQYEQEPVHQAPEHPPSRPVAAAPQFQETPTKPVDLATNPDAMALRAAMSVLELQRQQALRDMATLERQKGMALAEPQEFAEALQRGDIKSKDTLRNGIDSAYSSESESDESVEPSPVPDSRDTDARERTEGKAERAREFGELPVAQNVVRTPPINWKKYHIVGPALDKLHEAERKDPTEGRPRTDEDLRMEILRSKAKEGQVATFTNQMGQRPIQAPFDPFRDQLVSTEGVRGGGNTGVGAGGERSGFETMEIAADEASVEPPEKRRKSVAGPGKKKKGAKG